ncbi:MAG: tetratricopeptide repeat protein [Gemmatimonadales bacterium]
MFFMCLSMWLLSGIERASPWRWRALGVAMGCLALTRENALLLILVVIACIVLRRFYDGSTNVLRTNNSIVEPSSNNRRTFVEQLAPFLVGLALVLLPVMARNYSVGGGLYVTTSQFGSNFYIGNNPNADGTYASIRFGRGAPEFERLDAKEVAEESVGHALSPADVSSFWFNKSMDFIASDPARWVKLEGRKILLLFNRAEMIDTEAQESYAEVSTPLWLLGPIASFGILVPLAALGMIVAWPDRRRLWIVYALTLTYAASVVMFFVFARYRYPLVPLLLLFAGVGALAVADVLREKRWIAVAATAAVAVFANLPVLSSTLMMAITENNLGTALLDQHRYDEAIAHHQRALQLRPDYAPAYNNLGAAQRAAGRVDEAVASYRKALELKPDFASASFNLVNALLEQGKSADSAESFRRALDANPNSVEAHNNLGIALANKGETAGAIAEFRAALAIDERSVHAHRNLGNMLFDLGERTEGMAHLERAVAIAPKEPDAVYDIGTILLQAQNFSGAAARFDAALAIKPDWAEAHNNLGIALASQGRLAEALTHFERAMALKPSLADARANRDRARAALRQSR